MYDDVILPNVISWELLLEFPAEGAIQPVLGDQDSLLVSFLCSLSTGSSFPLQEWDIPICLGLG